MTYSHRPLKRATSMGSTVQCSAVFAWWSWRGQVSAVIAGYRWLFLGEAHQFLSDGFDERGGRVVGRGRLLQGSGGSVAQAERAQVGRSSRWLLQSVPGGLEYRDGGVVKRAKNLNNKWRKERKKAEMRGNMFLKSLKDRAKLENASYWSRKSYNMKVRVWRGHILHFFI